MAIVWRDQMSIDGGIIDADHKCLIDIINDIDSIRIGPEMPTQVGAILARLSLYAQAHFQREERLQVAVTFTYGDAHHHHHLDLTRQLDAMRDEYEKIRSPHQTTVFRRSLIEFLRHWLLDHICQADMLMKPFVAEMRRHAEAMLPLDEAVRTDVSPAAGQHFARQP